MNSQTPLPIIQDGSPGRVLYTQLQSLNELELFRNMIGIGGYSWFACTVSHSKKFTARIWFRGASLVKPFPGVWATVEADASTLLCTSWLNHELCLSHPTIGIILGKLAQYLHIYIQLIMTANTVAVAKALTFDGTLHKQNEVPKNAAVDGLPTLIHHSKDGNNVCHELTQWIGPRFTILNQSGAGAYGVVIKAKRAVREMEDIVAIKVFRSGVASDEEIRAEFDILQRLNSQLSLQLIAFSLIVVAVGCTESRKAWICCYSRTVRN